MVVGVAVSLKFKMLPVWHCTGLFIYGAAQCSR